jgi:SAM-dependent methyltransferase
MNKTTKEILSNIYTCPRKTISDGQKIKDIDFDYYNEICNGISTVNLNPNKVYKDTIMSPRLCTIFDIFYSRHMDINKSYLFLDCGCSDGSVTEYIGTNYSNIFVSGCDISINWVKYANSKHRNVFHADINNIETFGRCYYDIILCSKVLPLTRNFRKSLSTLCELLNPGGYIILLFGWSLQNINNHYCLIEHPDIVLNWIDTYAEFEDMNTAEVVKYNDISDMSHLIANDEVIIILHKGE